MQRGDRRRPRAASRRSTIRPSGSARIARLHLERLGRDRGPRRRLPGRAPPVDQVHGALLRHAAARIPRHHPRRHRRRPGARALFRREINATARREAVLRRARRDGDQLDPEPRGAMLARRGGRRRSSISSSTEPRAASATRGAAEGTMIGSDQPPCSAPASWARRSPPHFANAGAAASLLLDVTADVARDGLERAREAQARSVLHARRRRAHPHRRFRRRSRGARGRGLDRRSDRRAPRRQAGADRDASMR